jgi:hypothetical protein
MRFFRIDFGQGGAVPARPQGAIEFSGRVFGRLRYYERFSTQSSR